MLNSLRIQNFAIIENTEIDFRTGMTVLTGETGAGKTIIIDAIGLLLGDRAVNEMIRHGEKKATIEGVFIVQSAKLKEELEKLGIEVTDDLLITRTLTEGRSTLRINNQVVTLGSLKKISRYLIDIHLQHDTYRLVDPANYIELLDNYADIDLNNYHILRDVYIKSYNKHQTLLNETNNMNEQLDYLKFQLEELQDANLNADEENELIAQQHKLENHDKLFGSLQKAFEYLGKVTNANLHGAVSELNRISEFEQFEELKNRLESATIEIDDIAESIQDEYRSLDFDPNELNRIQTRLTELNRLKRKHNMTISELIEKADSLHEKISNFENKDYIIEESFKELKDNHLLVVEEGLRISNKRKRMAKELENSLVMELKDLHLSNVRFKIEFVTLDSSDPLKASSLLVDGIDEIDFAISTNVGEPLKPLSKTASGGEMSRIMLALKTVLLKTQGLSSIIFDEIDSGVSGQVAHGIAQKISTISKDTQVLLITHLPQVAAIANNHIFVSKKVEDGRTISNTTYLSVDERVEAIAKMLSNDNITQSALEHAKELLDDYQR